MLKQIRITNFKAVADSELLPVCPLAVLIGRNGSGKSSLLEALDWLGRAVDEGAEAATEPFQRITDILRGWSDDTTRTFSITLVLDPEDASIGQEIVYTVEVGVGTPENEPRIALETLNVKSEGDKDAILIRTEDGTRLRWQEVANEIKAAERTGRWISTTDPDRLVLSETDPTQLRAGALLKSFLERTVFLRLNPRAIASFAPTRIKPTPRLLDEEGRQLAYLLGQLDEETLRILIGKLSLIIEEAHQLDSHSPVGPADRRYFTFVESRGGEERPLQIPAWMLSEGTRRITAILAVLLQDDPPPMLCIEEVENGLDPWTLKFLLEELAGAIERGTQVMLTTHSPYLLDMLPQESIILCDRRPYGVEFFAADKLPEMEVLQMKMGLGALYTNRYLYPEK
jgi:predicted ATPase